MAAGHDFQPRLLIAKSRVGGPNLLQSRAPSGPNSRQPGAPPGAESEMRADAHGRTLLGEREGGRGGADSRHGAATGGKGAQGEDTAAAGWAISGVHVCGRAMVSLQVMPTSLMCLKNRQRSGRS